MGGDEFNIILPAMHSERQLEAWAGGLLAEIGQVYLIDDRLVQISGSIGCCRITGGGDDKVVQKADYALMHAKRNGKDRVVVFREEHEQDAAERFAIEQALRIADFDAEIELLFQPQYRLGEQRFAIAEALARWNSPTIGKVEPDRFITIAEESGLIAKITLAVVDKALAQVAHWDGRIAISINLSGHDLLSDQIINQIVGKVRSAGVDPALVEFEVTETAMMVDLQRAIANLNRLAQLGHGLALDDFGTGYSNFTYLRSLPIGKLKVDGSFMQDVADPMTEKVLRSLVGMARTLDVECLLEGVESELELALAKRVGAQSVQGYLFGRPMTAGEVIARHGVADNPAGDAALRA
jgi:predicted signal transduction protein with EAL and GGDEF domain